MLGQVANTINRLSRNINSDNVYIKIGLYIKHQGAGTVYVASEGMLVPKMATNEAAKELFDKVNAYGRKYTYHNGYGYYICVTDPDDWKQEPLCESVGGSFPRPWTW